MSDTTKQLRVESPDLHAQFQAMCPEAPLPWERGTGRKRWAIVDATGEEVCGFDGSAEETPRLMAMIILAVNTCGGFKAQLEEPQP